MYETIRIISVVMNLVTWACVMWIAHSISLIIIVVCFLLLLPHLLLIISPSILLFIDKICLKLLVTARQTAWSQVTYHLNQKPNDKPSDLPLGLSFFLKLFSVFKPFWWLLPPSICWLSSVAYYWQACVVTWH